ncbi:uncharacterized protein PG986_014660 [Apiospora aurea]|uniref:DUF7730 domain-containing protein n=1 Tax=Apiospora aurea TaxID=335848 RepID=A0ABR1PTM1_9PEZI
MSSPAVKVQSQTSPAVRCSKRKRAAVSYVETDLDDDFLCDAETEEQQAEEDDDGEFGKPHKKRKRTVKPKKQQKPFPFQSLPAELRNIIYSMVLTDSRGAVHLEAKGKSHRRIAKHRNPFRPSTKYHSWRTQAADGPTADQWDRYGDYRLTPALLATCQAVHAEAAPLLYGQRFVAQDGFALAAFLMQLSPARVALLRRVAIRKWVDTRSHTSTNLPAAALLRDAAPGLARFEIQTGLVSRYIHSCGSGYRDRHNAVAPELRLARKVYRDCHPLLYAVMRARGFDAVLDVVRLVEDEWHCLAAGHRGSNTASTAPAENADREILKYKGLYADELRRLMTGH